MRKLAGALVVGVALAGLAGCGDDEVTIDPEADEEVIEDAILTVDDLPDGYEVTESDADDDDDEEAVADECLEEAGFDADALEDATVVEGDPVDFQLLTDDALVGITASIRSFDDVEVARDALEGYQDDEFVECVVADAQDDETGEGELPVDDIEGEVIDPPVDGDGAASVRLTFTIDGAPAFGDQHLLLVGRFGIALEVLSLGGGIDDDEIEELLDTMADRVEDATDD